MSDKEMSDKEMSDNDLNGVDMNAFSKINIRNLSIKCGNCENYQTLSGFKAREDGWNIYTYECENEICDPALTRTLLEVPGDLDEFANRDLNWRGGRVHAGAEPGHD